VVLVVVLLALLSWHPGIEALAADQINSGFKRALLTFASARALNAVFSVLQGTEVAAQPFGIGVTLTLGQVLEPANRAVEQFSTVMLYATVAFGIQKTLLVVGSWWPISAALTFLSVIWAALYWIRRPQLWLSRLLLMLFIVRFAVPAVTIGSDYVFDKFLAQDYAAGQKYLQAAPEQMERLAPINPADTANKSFTERMKSAVSSPLQAVKQRYENLRAAAEQIVERMIQLIVVFLLQTIVLPLLFLWMLFRAAKGLLIQPTSPPTLKTSQAE
jgi:hypothetical protein